MKKDKIYVGNTIKTYRKLKGLTQEKLAELANISYQQLQQYEYNKSNPSLSLLSKFSRILEIPPEKFFTSYSKDDLMDKVNSGLNEEYEIVNLVKKAPEVKELINFYVKTKNKFNIKELLNILNSFKELSSKKRTILLNFIKKFSEVE